MTDQKLPRWMTNPQTQWECWRNALSQDFEAEQAWLAKRREYNRQRAANRTKPDRTKQMQDYRFRKKERKWREAVTGGRWDLNPYDSRLLSRLQVAGWTITPPVSRDLKFENVLNSSFNSFTGDPGDGISLVSGAQPSDPQEPMCKHGRFLINDCFACDEESIVNGGRIVNAQEKS